MDQRRTSHFAAGITTSATAMVRHKQRMPIKIPVNTSMAYHSKTWMIPTTPAAATEIPTSTSPGTHVETSREHPQP